MSALDMLECTKCKTTKPLDEFYRQVKSKHGRQSQCKVCSNELKRIYHQTQAYKDRATAYRKSKVGRDSIRIYRKSVHGKARTLFNSAIKRSRERDIEFDLDINWIKERVAAGSCEVTGIKFVLDAMSGQRRHPFAPSLDRRDSNKGYTVDNVQVVCWIFNGAKSDFDLDAVLTLSRALVSKFGVCQQ